MYRDHLQIDKYEEHLEQLANDYQYAQLAARPIAHDVGNCVRWLGRKLTVWGQTLRVGAIPPNGKKA